MLHHYQDQGRCKLLGVVVDRQGEDCAAVADMMNTYYGHGNIPIGLERNGLDDPVVFIDYKNVYKHTTATGEPMFRRTVSDYSALPDGWKLYRQLLALQPDHSVSICSIGFVCSLVQLLESQPDQFSLSEHGIVTLTSTIATVFTPSATGRHRYQKPGTPEWNDMMLEKIRAYNF